jgi:hypothetical protein
MWYYTAMCKHTKGARWLELDLRIGRARFHQALGRNHSIESVVSARSFCAKALSLAAYRPLSGMLAAHFAPCAKICVAATFLSNECLRPTRFPKKVATRQSLALPFGKINFRLGIWHSRKPGISFAPVKVNIGEYR